jgi:hypothetical protein
MHIQKEREMKKIALGISLVALSASAAWAQGQTAGPTTVPPPPRGAQTAPTPAPAATPTTAPTYGKTAAGPQRDVPPYTSEVGPRRGDWEGFIGGSGTSNGEFNSNTLGVSASVGYYVLEWLPVSLRQSALTNFGSRVNDQWAFATTGAVDFQAPFGRFQPFLGGFAGYSYGDQNSGLAGPEGGIKYYVNESTFVQGLMQYGWLFDKTLDWDNGRATYTIGLGWNF